MTWQIYAAGSDADDFEAFCRDFLTHWVDQWAGSPFLWEPFQQRMMGEALAFDEHGDPFWHSVVIVMPRKNGKTQLLAAYAVWRLLVSQGSPEILLAASSDRQAGRLFEASATFLRQNEGLAELVRPRDYIGEIAREDGGGKILRMSSSPERLHGYNPSDVICDELAQWTTPTLKRAFAALVSGGAARKAPRAFTITTAGEAHNRHDSILGRLVDAAEGSEDAIREPGLTVARLWDSRTLVWNYSAPTADPNDVEAMKLANPASWVTLEYLAKQAANPELTDADVLQLHGCVWAEGVDAWVTAEQWQACFREGIEPPEGARVIAGVDIGLVHDSSSVALAWLLEDGTVGVQAKVWATDAHTSHDVLVAGRMNLALIEDYLRDIAARFNLVEVAYDPRFFERSAQMLAGEGLQMVALEQSSGNMADAYQDWFQGVLEKKIAHAGGSVLTAHVMSTAAESTERGWKVRKLRQTSRIDATVASVMAHYRCRATQSVLPVVVWA